MSPRRAHRRARRLGAARVLALRSSPAARPSAGSRQANALRHAGDAKGALAAYKAILADLGDGPLPDGRRGGPREGAPLRGRRLLPRARRLHRRPLLLPAHRLAPARRRRRRYEARAVIGDIYRDRFNDHARRHRAVRRRRRVRRRRSRRSYQLEVARGYLALGALRAGAHRGAHPPREVADARARRRGAAPHRARPGRSRASDDEALGAFQALVDREPRPEMAARALEGAGAHPRAGGPVRPGPRALRARAADAPEPRRDPHQHRGGARAPREGEDRDARRPRRRVRQRKVKRSPREAP